MPWNDIANVVVRGFTGKPIRLERRDADMEVVCKPIRCPVKDCVEKFTSLPDFRAHVSKEGLDLSAVTVTVESELEDATVATLIFETLLRFNSTAKDNPAQNIRKSNDSHRSGEVWRRVSIAVEQGKNIRLKDEEYKWLGMLLDRQLPIGKAEKDEGQEVKTLGMALWTGHVHQVTEALKSITERKAREPDDDEAVVEPSTNGVVRLGDPQVLQR